MDRFSAEDRSKIMSQVKNKNTKPELKIRKFLFSQGYRYRINVKNLPGCPDIVLPKYKTVIFVNGCFWHGHSNCKRAKLPQSNSDFWEKKILSNIARDKLNHALLESMGWNVVVIWSCEINQLIKFGTVEKLLLNSGKKKPASRQASE
jgi:DNA mismatch endonuclease (patch repair protein)